MFYRILQIIIGIIFSIVFFLVYKYVTNNDKQLKENSFLKIFPIAIGTLNILITIYIIIMIVFINSTFEIKFQNDIINILYSIFTSYHYVFASSISIGAIILTLLLKKKKHISEKIYWYCIITNVISAIILLI